MSDDVIPDWARDTDSALAGYGYEGSSVELLSLRENAVFRVTSPSGDVRALRLCRPGYRSVEELTSEAEWVRALCDESVVRVPAFWPDLAGELVHVFRANCIEQTAVLTEFVTGEAPSIVNRGTVFRQLGAQTARLHDHAARWPRPAGWSRPRWDLDALTGPNARWGDWRKSRHITPDTEALFEDVESDIRQRLSSPGTPLPDLLVHADLHPGNVLVSEGNLILLDFDDCGLSWPLWDLACAMVGDSLDLRFAAE
ncbi:MAG: serine/threonine protein kinase [Subtercola sp.]|nr:serine/threonine protein kinase [Subtercola sp.]